MGPKKSSGDWSNETGYPGLLHKLCKEEDVLIIPQFVAHYVGRQPEHSSPRKSKESRMTERHGSSSLAVRESTKEDILLCDALAPPQLAIIYGSADDRDSPLGLICRKIYMEYSLIRAIGKSLKPYPTINCLKIEDCCLSKDLADELAVVLAEEPGRRISDLSLDGNENLATILPLFVSFPTGVRYLSLRRCSLADEDVKIFAKGLEYSDEIEHKLQVLNLGMNKIRDAGVSYLANALRTNRSLVSLSLAGNQIGDDGVLYLTEILGKFPLTHPEIMLRRRRIFDEILKKKTAVEKYLEEWKMKGDVESQSSRISIKSAERTGRKIRGLDGKIRCLSSRDKRSKPNQGKMNPGEKFRGKIRNGVEEVQNGVEPTPVEISAIAQQVDSEIPPDKHPFVTEAYMSDDWIWCNGCWSLANINLAYNYLTEKSSEYFTKVAESQAENFPPKLGLLRLVILPGNSIHEDSSEFQKLQSSLIYRNSKKDVPELSDPISVGSLSSARKISSMTRRTKNR